MTCDHIFIEDYFGDPEVGQLFFYFCKKCGKSKIDTEIEELDEIETLSEQKINKIVEEVELKVQTDLK